MGGKLTLAFPGLPSQHALAPNPIAKSNPFWQKLRRGMFFDNSEEQSSRTSLRLLTPIFPKKSVKICAHMKRLLLRELSPVALVEEF